MICYLVSRGFPNLFLKFSSLTLRATAHMETLLPRTIDHFGPHRLVWEQIPRPAPKNRCASSGPPPPALIFLRAGSARDFRRLLGASLAGPNHNSSTEP